MPTQAQHLTQATRNANAVDLIQEEGRVLEWAATALFYQGLHLVNAFLLQYKLSPSNHRDRQKAVHLMMRSVSAEYDELASAGQGARYHCRRFSDSEITDLRAAVTVIDAHVRTELARGRT
jgi:uncharacterized protein (UPF0332 family)